MGLGVRRLAQGHRGWDRTSNPPTARRLLLPPEALWPDVNMRLKHRQRRSSPGVVVAGAHTDGVAEAGQGLLQLLGEHELVAQQRVGIGEAGVHLDGPLEQLDGLVMLLLQAEAVSRCTPGLGKRQDQTTSPSTQKT